MIEAFSCGQIEIYPGKRGGKITLDDAQCRMVSCRITTEQWTI